MRPKLRDLEDMDSKIIPQTSSLHIETPEDFFDTSVLENTALVIDIPKKDRVFKKPDVPVFVKKREKDNPNALF